MTDTLPADLCIIGQMLLDCTMEGAVFSAGWRFVREQDIASRDRNRRIYYLDFNPVDRSFSGKIRRGDYTIDSLTPAEVKVLRSLLPKRELARALALSITRPAS